MRRKFAATQRTDVANLPPRIANLPPRLSQKKRKSAATLLVPIYKPIGVGGALWTTWGRSRLWRGSAGGLLPPDPRGCAPGRAFARPAPRWVVLKTPAGAITQQHPFPAHCTLCMGWEGG